ncbi:DUF922 domain-containing protein [Algibacter sp. L4_22]|uniref:DUF922 domain-containing protein n=1 Tax=Algibacter sp. L4_22 TaxID=2942477 RepID=UPI00201B46B4|nr:DUF922 domain-containing protein [Algibacter sp. L4_22]MCL5127924.1 DUF922 domain-containing protein [Algibacter sp. L4_22]
MIRTLVLLCCFIGFQTEKPVISWTDNYKLSWTDFRGKPKQNSGAVAETASGISFGFSLKKLESNVVSFSTEVNAYFYPEDSWFHPEQASAYILGHEQLHFDITELFARKFRKGISELKISNNIKEQLKTLYKNSEKGLGMMQRQYDAETNHSKNPEIQKEWQLYIKSELDKLSKYKSIE